MVGSRRRVQSSSEQCFLTHQQTSEYERLASLVALWPLCHAETEHVHVSISVLEVRGKDRAEG
jgi:hypothetical protein